MSALKGVHGFLFAGSRIYAMIAGTVRWEPYRENVTDAGS